MKELMTALANARAQFGTPHRDKNNPGVNARYASLNSVKNAVDTALVNNGLDYIQIPSIDEKDGQPCLVTTLFHLETGQAISSTIPLLFAQGDFVELFRDDGKSRKILNNKMQGYGSSLRYACRYAIEAMCSVQREDDDARAAYPQREQDRAPQRAQEQRREINQAIQRDNSRNIRANTPVEPVAPEKSKAQKLLEWAGRHDCVVIAQSMAQLNYKVKDILEINDEQATQLYELLKVAKPVSAPKLEAQHAENVVEKPNHPERTVSFGWPKQAADLFPWCRNLETHYKLAIVRLLYDGFVKTKGWPRLYSTWTPEQVNEAALTVARRVSQEPSYNGEFNERLPNLDALRTELVTNIQDYLTSVGFPGASDEDINLTAHQHSEQLEDQNGELITDIRACDNESLIRAVIASVKRDIEDGATV